MRRFLHILAAAWTWLFVSVSGQAQIAFRPHVETFGKLHYGADSQNWSVAEGSPGEIFVGNDEGLLRYDGYRWELNRLPGGSPVYSILVDGDRIYTGGVREFGYWTRTPEGEFGYHSLSAGMEEDRLGRDEIWTILKQGDRILFHAFHAFHVVSPEKTTTFRTPSFMMSPHILESGELLVYLRGEGLAVLDIDADGGGNFRLFEGLPFRTPMASVLATEDGSYRVLTYREGIFRMEGERMDPFPTEADGLIKSAIPRQALVHPLTGSILVGTHLGGLLALSPDGELRYSFGADDGTLPSNQIFGMTLDSFGNLWLALGRGIAMVSMVAQIWQSDDLGSGMGVLNTAAYRAPWLYLGTSRGLFRGLFQPEFRRLEGIEQVESVGRNVLDLYQSGDQLFCGTGGPTYEIFPDRVLPVCPEAGGAEMDAGIIHDKEVLLQRTYSGLCIYLRENGRWQYSHTLPGFSDPVRAIKLDVDGMLWVKELYGGLRRIKLDETLTRIESDMRFGGLGEASLLPLSINRLGNRVLFADGKTGFYAYDDIHGSLLLYDRLRNYPTALSLDPLSKDEYAIHFPEDVFFVHHGIDTLAVLGRISQERLGGVVPDGLRHVVPLPGNRSLFLRENSLTVCQVDSRTHVECPGMTLSRFVGHDFEQQADSLFSPDVPHLRIPWRYHHLSLSYEFPRFGLLFQPEFRYRVEGLEHAFWEHLGKVPDITLNHLSEGYYKLTIQALTPDGEVLSSFTHAFVIRPPWRRSAPMIVLYVLLVCFVLFLLWRLMKLREQDRLHKLEFRLHQSEMSAASAELAQRTIDSIHWNETLLRIKDMLGSQKERLGKNYPDKDYQAVCEIIDKEMFAETDWDVFEAKFNRAYDNFLARLKTRYPGLSSSDLRFCAYVRMGMTNREAASIMNITQRGAETARYRIKKKLGLSADDSMEAFLKKF